MDTLLVRVSCINSSGAVVYTQDCIPKSLDLLVNGLLENDDDKEFVRIVVDCAIPVELQL